MREGPANVRGKIDTNIDNLRCWIYTDSVRAFDLETSNLLLKWQIGKALDMRIARVARKGK